MNNLSHSHVKKCYNIKRVFNKKKKNKKKKRDSV